MKKIVKIFAVILLLAVIAAIAVPILFKDKFAKIVKTEINKRVNANVDFTDIDISLFRNFPKASLKIEGLSILNKAPFAGDTLLYVNEISLKMPLSSLTKTDASAIEINSFVIDEAFINVVSNENGIINTDISKIKESSLKEVSDTKSSFAFSVEEYAIKNSILKYTDDFSGVKISLSDFNHNGAGNLSEAITTLQTKTASNISFLKGESVYLDNHKISLKADLEIDQEKNKYTFLENTLSVNELLLKFNGFVQSEKMNTIVDITFSTPTSDFENFIALMPKSTTTAIEDIKTKGSFTIDGFAKGMISENTIPKFEVNVSSKEASLKYPDLTKSIEHINLVAALKNTTGNKDDTSLGIDRLALQIDQDIFKASGKVINLLGDNPLISANLDGVLNLANLSKAYPIQMDNELKGLLEANLQTAFSQKALDNNNFELMKNEGSFTISDFQYASKDIVNPIDVKKATIGFSTKEIRLNSFDAKSGASDISATGVIDNLLGFLFSDKKLKGDFNVKSNHLNISDFMVDNTSKEENSHKESKKGEGLKIPAFLDVKLAANAKTVIYDNLTLKNVKGDLIIKDESATLQNMTTEMFDGTMSINGNVKTKGDKPIFDLDLGIDQFDIEKSFVGMELLKSLAPIAKILKGKLNTKIKVSGEVADDFSLNTESLTGNAFAEVLTKSLNSSESNALSLLDNQLSFMDLSKLDLKNLKTALSFKEGKVSLSPFNLKYDDIDIEIMGTHGFDQSLGYTATFDVPAKYFGNEVGSLLSKLSDEDVKDVKVPVIANITGNMTKPQVNTDMKQSISNLTNQLIQIQKNKLLQQGSDTLSGMLGGVLGGGSTPDDTPKDSLQTDSGDPIKDVATDIIGGLFGGKKKKKK